MVRPIFTPETWAMVPFHFWSVAAFVLGSVVGSFLNVCIYRLPLGQSVVSPPSHCPHCNYAIPWYLNIPLVTWVYLRAKCRHCGAPISIRYFLVELLTALVFLSCWLAFGRQSAWLALAYAVFLSGLIVATFIDFEHLIIPDELTIGWLAVGFAFSFVLPSLQGEVWPGAGMRQSLLGAAMGAGLIYAVLRLGKMLFGRHKVTLPTDTRVFFTENAILLPEQEIPYEEVFYRQSDTITLHARTVELVDRCYKEAEIRLSPSSLRINDETLKPEEVPHMEAVTGEVVLPREAMGLGDVKFMAAIGAFLGWKAVIFSLMVSSLIGSVVGITLVVTGRQAWSSRLPYGPYIALAAAIWVFTGRRLIASWLGT